MYSLINGEQSSVTDRDQTTLKVLYACPRFAVWQGPRPPEELAGKYERLRLQFDVYRLQAPHKAFAVFFDRRLGHWSLGWAADQQSEEAAIAKSLERCEEARGTRKGKCRVFAIGDEVLHLEEGNPSPN